MRSRAHTGFVGEQAALDALADSGLERVAEAAADDCIRLERVLEDHAEGLGNEPDAHDEDGKASENVEHRHDGDELLCDERDALDAAEEDKPSNDRDCNADHPCGYAECV